MGPHRLQRRRRVEALHQHQRRPRVEAQTEHDVEAEYVEQGQDSQGHVTGVHGPARVELHLLEVGEQVAVGQHRGLGRARGSGREDEHGGVAGGPVEDGNGGVGATVAAGRLRLPWRRAVDGDDPLHDRARAVEGASRARVIAGRDGKLGPHRLPLRFELDLGGVGVEGHGYRPDPQHREVGHDEEAVVGQGQGHAVPRHHSQLHQRSSGLGHQGAQPAVGDGPGPVVKGRRLLRMGLDDGGEVHRRPCSVGPAELGPVTCRSRGTGPGRR